MASAKATRIELFSLATPQMRAFHLAWLAFFVCFFAWFATAPLMPVIGADLHLAPDQMYTIGIAGVLVTVVARFVIGPMCDRYGPRITYTALLALGAIPVAGVAFAWDYPSFLIFRLLIGIIGASFVLTQFHTSVMFAPNVVGTANATVGGWGNAGGGVTQTVMPLLLAGLGAWGLSKGLSWRYAQILPTVLMVGTAILYWRFTQDTPEGNFSDLRRRGIVLESGKKEGFAAMAAASGNYRTWILAAGYGASFGVELFVHSIAATYYYNHYHLSLEDAGLAVGGFGLLALFARAVGGLLSDRVARRRGLDGRIWLLSGLLVCEGVFLIAFAQAGDVVMAVSMMLVFGLFTHMACGGLYALYPFVDRKALGGVAGIIGAGGNVGGVLAGLLLRFTGQPQLCFMVMGVAALICGVAALAVRFSPATKQAEQAAYEAAIAQRGATGLPAAA